MSINKIFFTFSFELVLNNHHGTSKALPVDRLLHFGNITINFFLSNMVTNLVYGSGIFKVGLVQMAAISVDDEGMLEAEDGISNPDLELNQLTDYSDLNFEEEMPGALSKKKARYAP